MHNGYIALHRKLLDNPIVCKDADHLAVWVWLLLKASWRESDVLFNGKRITLQPGELPPISRRTIAKDLGISDSKVQRILKLFENEHQIEQRTTSQSRLISIVSWDKYQVGEPLTEPRVNHDRTTSEPRVNTIEEINKNNKGNNLIKGGGSVVNRLTERESDAIFRSYEDADLLIDEIDEEIRLKGIEVRYPFGFIIEYAQRKGWTQKNGKDQ